MSSRRKKVTFSLDWALLFLLVLALFSSLLSVIRYNRFVRDVQASQIAFTDRITTDFARSNDDLRSIVNDFIGRASRDSFCITNIQANSSSVLTNDYPDVERPSSLPRGFWVCQVQGRWLLTDGHLVYPLGSRSPFGFVLRVDPGVVETDSGVYYGSSTGGDHE